MLRVTPQRVEVLKNGHGTRLVLKATKTPDVFYIHLPISIGQRISLELNGLAVDRCGDHHVGPMVAKACGRDFSSLVLTNTAGDWMAARFVLQAIPGPGRDDELKVPVSVPSSVATAIHLRLPIYVEQVAKMPGATKKAGTDGVRATAQIPPAFRDVINGLDWRDLDAGAA